MADKRTKTIAYRRAVWFAPDKKDRDLEDLVQRAHKTLKGVKQRQFKRLDGQLIKCVKHLASKTGSFVHVVSDTPGDHASTVPSNIDDLADFDVGVSPPPRDREYMDGDILAYIKGNHVCVCSTGLRDASLTLYLHQLFEAAGLGKDSTMFELASVADASKIKLIEAQGVKSIDIRATLYDASLKYVKRKSRVLSALGVAGKHLAAIAGNDKAAPDDNLMVTLEVSTDDRRVKGRALGAERMKELAKEVIDGDDEYVIVTRQNQRISQGEIYLRQKVQLDRQGKSVERAKAWQALRDFYSQLVKSGAVAQ